MFHEESMKLKKEYIILVVIIIALSLYLVLHKTDGTHYKLPDVPEIAKNKITKLEIGQSDEKIVLNKKDKTWYIGSEEYPADSDKMKNMLDLIEKLNVTALVSESKNYVRYDLSSDKKINVKAWEGKTLKREFDIGKPASTYRHTFIKLKEDSNVYHVRGDFNRRFDQTIEKLRDRTVLSFEEDDIQQIHISKDKETVIIAKKEISKKDTDEDTENGNTKKTSSPPVEKEMIWQTAQGEKVDESKLDGLISTLSGMECEKYINDKTKEDFKDPNYVIRLKGTQEHTISVFPNLDKNEKNHPAISSDNNYPFLLSDFQMKDIKRVIDEIMKTDD